MPNYFQQVLGAPAKTFRIALGALIIKEKIGISDRETVEQIKENPYLQYFIGLCEYSNSPPFDAEHVSTFSGQNQRRASQQSQSSDGQKNARKLRRTNRRKKARSRRSKPAKKSREINN